MDLTDRFKYIIKLNNLSSSSFADEIGVQRSSVSHILSGRNKPSMEFIEKVLKRFPKVNADWLITGNTKIEKDDLISNNPLHKLSTEEKTSSPPTPTSRNTNKQIKKVVIFYTDNTFEEIVSGS